MANYLTLVKFTSQGLANYKDTTRRAADIREMLAQRGVEVLHLWWCMGPYDGFLEFRAENDEAASAAMLSIASQGFVQLTTIRVFNEEEMNRIVNK
jgi:uncharacterized protein with GYD domain